MKKNRALLILLILILMFHVSFAEARPAAKAFPTRSIIIGSYVIDYKALNPKTISLAQDTVESSGQKKIYYKSDLTSQKIWVDITNGERISDISDKSTSIISDAMIDALPLTHWIKADASVIVFGTGEVKSINDMHSLLDPKAHELLQKLSIDYDLAKNLFDADDEDVVSEMTQNILAPVLMPLSQATIEGYDQQLAAWDAFSAYLTANGGSDAAINLVSAEKGTTFINREIAVNTALLGRLNDAANSAVKKGLNALNGDIWESIGKVEAQIIELQEGLNIDESSFLALYRATQEKKLLQAIASKDYKTAESSVEIITHADHISAGLIIDKPSELEILTITFGQSIQKIKAIAAEGNGIPYYTALKNGEPAATLKVLIEAQISNLKEAISELQRIMDDTIARLDQSEAQQVFLGQAVEAMSKALDAIPKESAAIAGAEGNTASSGTDEASLVSTQSPADLLSSLKEGFEDQLNVVKAFNDPETIEQLDYLDALKAKNDNLYKTFLGALENNDTALADEIKANMSVIADKQDALYDSFASLYKQANDGIVALETKIENNNNLLTAQEPATSELSSENDALKAQVTKLKEDLAKFALLLDPTDKQLLDLYTDALVATQERIAEGDLIAINDALETLLTLFTILPDALKSEGDFSTLTSLLIEASKEAYLANLEDQGDALLALTAKLTPSQIEALLALSSGVGNNAIGATAETASGTDTATALGSGMISAGATVEDTPSMQIIQSDSGQYILVRVPTTKIQGITYVPIKTFYNLFNIEVIWHPESVSVEVKGIMQTEIFIEDSKVVKKEDILTIMDYPMKIIGGVSYAPIAYYTTDRSNFIMPNISNLTLIIIPLN
ncbi:stalk domain-containing protein [Fusibacter sp. 3D3]|uniref:stalk domain-containing protein n=1 Tax=Fusibacter sp. 3D3 TaxID=1048380 RepID=UPI00085374AC|nr:stalk domain-containing protein [Fusibacter sp. 3D3]GAU77495.1 hypothetical protein F3D3_2124 [Fusibacter sp. 3D3]